MVPDEDVDAVVDLNLKGTIYMSRLVSRRMLARGGGHIVNISSIVGRSGYRGLAVYSATKAALDGFTRALARELGSRGIIVNGVAPGYLRTEMSHGLDEAQLGQIVRRTPAGRLGEPADIARAVQFLTDPANTYLTGQILVVDGGLTC
jgi:3-oxoacyl-[acyl-carrier protein] reductase